MWHSAISDIIERLASSGDIDQASGVLNWAAKLFPAEERHMFDKVTCNLVEIYEDCNNFTGAWALLKSLVDLCPLAIRAKTWTIAIRGFIQRLESHDEIEHALEVTKWALNHHAVEDGWWTEQIRVKYKLNGGC